MLELTLSNSSGTATDLNSVLKHVFQLCFINREASTSDFIDRYFSRVSSRPTLSFFNSFIGTLEAWLDQAVWPKVHKIFPSSFLLQRIAVITSLSKQLDWTQDPLATTHRTYAINPWLLLFLCVCVSCVLALECWRACVRLCIIFWRFCKDTKMAYRVIFAGTFLCRKTGTEIY